jgi:hypothetical protein
VILATGAALAFALGSTSAAVAKPAAHHAPAKPTVAHAAGHKIA